MKLLGRYTSHIAEFYAEELLKLVESSAALGDFGGSKLVDPDVAAWLTTQAQDFASLPSIPAGMRATPESIDYALSLLRSRYAAIVNERADFIQRIDRFVSVLEKDASLVDQLIAAAQMERWVSRQPALTGAVKFHQDFAASHGAAGVTIPLTDPETGVLYTRKVRDASLMLNALPLMETEPLRTGIAAPVSTAQIKPATIRWHYNTSGLAEELVSEDWAKLSLLEPLPRLVFGAPAVSVMVPETHRIDGLFEFGGAPLFGNLPVYVRTFFVPRRQSATIRTGDATVPIAFTSWAIVQSDFIVTDETRSYEQGIDYTVDAAGCFVPKAILANKQVSLLFSEMYPAYQCSTNGQDWSPTVVLDEGRPYASGESYEVPLQIARDPDGARFPVIDESGRPLGLWIRRIGRPQNDFLLRIDTPASSQVGARAVLEVELDRPAFLTGFHLAPFVNFPVRVRALTAEGLTSDSGGTLWSGDVLLEREVTLCFPKQLVRRLFIHFQQENYSFKEHLIDPADKLRRDTLLNIQAVLPIEARRFHISESRRVRGVQYEFGFRNLWGEETVGLFPQDRGVFVAGPFEVLNTPELIRLDFDSVGDVKAYLLDMPFSSTNVLMQSYFHPDNPHGLEVTNGEAVAYIPSADAPTAKVRFYVKFVLREEAAVVERMLLQVTTHV